jgi:hypothetical protein
MVCCWWFLLFCWFSVLYIVYVLFLGSWVLFREGLLGLVCWLSDCGVLVCPFLLHVYARVFYRCFFPWDLISDYILVMAFFFFLQLVACLRKERDVIIFCSTWFVLFNVLLLICAWTLARARVIFIVVLVRESNMLLENLCALFG